MVLSELTLGLLLAGFAGGIVGAAIGGLPALSLAGLTIVAGEAVAVAFPDADGTTELPVFEVAPAPVDAIGITGAVGLGPVLGPHVAFAGGVAAAAYAGRKEMFDTGFRYHQAKQIARPLPSIPPVLLVGGAFGLGGVVVARLAAGLNIPVDPIALAVVISALAHRLAFGYPLLGRVRGLDRPVLDMSPFENSEYWGDEENETAQGTGGRHVVEPWLPDHYEWQSLTVLGAGVGIAAGYIALATGSVFLAFGIAASSLLFLSLGAYSLPVTHHMALPASIGAVALDADPVLALLFAGVFGILGALVGEVAQRTLYAHADTHFDPSFASILVTSLMLTLLATAGVLEAGPIPYPVL